MREIKYIILVFVLGIFVSCDDDYLTENNPNGTSIQNFWKNLDDTDIGLAAAYNSLLNEDILTLIDDSYRSDMGWPGWGRPIPSAKGASLSIYDKAYTNSFDFVEAKWNACYTGIFRANQVIGALNKLKNNGSILEESEEAWTIQMGQARFIRGLLHFYLHTIYNNGKIIINDRIPLTSDDLAPNISRADAVLELLANLNIPLSSSQEVITFFREDLKYAFDNLPAVYENPSQDLGRATKGAAATILGTSHLYQEEYTLAMNYFDDLINNGAYGYELVDDMSLMFTTKGEFNKESIFELNYNSTFNQDVSIWSDAVLSNQYARTTVDSRGAMLPVWIIDKYKNDPLDTSDPRNSYDNSNSSSGTSLRPLSLRASTMVAIVEDDITPYYVNATTAERIKLAWNGWGYGYYKKYTNHDIFEGGEKFNPDPRGERSSAKNVVLNRLAEVYLMQAECMIKTGDIPGALKQINTVRHRWALELLGPADNTWSSATFNEEIYTSESLMEQLMYVEKPLELSFEGNSTRWTDLRRWGVLKENFKRLSESTYYAVNYTYKKLNGTTASKASSSILSENPGSGNGRRIINYEYDDAYNNYNSDLHDYLPIPASEVMRNSSINQ